MKTMLEFFKTTLLGGLLVILPVWLTTLLVLKALMHLEIFVKPVSTHLPPDVIHPRVIAVLALLALCFLVGLAIRTAIGRRVKAAVERQVLERVPGYTLLRGVAEQMADMHSDKGLRPALIEIEEALAPGFIVERHADGKYTVFVPSAPTPAAGAIYVIAAARVHPVDVPLTTMVRCISQWGAGCREILAAMRPVPPQTPTDTHH